MPAGGGGCGRVLTPGNFEVVAWSQANREMNLFRGRDAAQLTVEAPQTDREHESMRTRGQRALACGEASIDPTCYGTDSRKTHRVRPAGRAGTSGNAEHWSGPRGWQPLEYCECRARLAPVAEEKNDAGNIERTGRRPTSEGTASGASNIFHPLCRGGEVLNHFGQIRTQKCELRFKLATVSMAWIVWFILRIVCFGTRAEKQGATA
jgi:hypothetical protein